MSDRVPYIVRTLAVCFGLLLLIFFEPLSYDNAIYQQMAREIIQYHRLPYLATWDQNLPGIIYLHYLAIWLFDTGDVSVRILDIILQLGFCTILYRVCRLWLNEHTAAIATVLYAAFYVSGGQSVYFERDGYAAMCCITAFYLLARTYERNTLHILGLIVSALLAGYSILLKPTAGLYVLWVALFLLVEDRKYALKTRIARLMSFLFIAAIPLSILLIFYASIPGGLNAIYLATVRYNTDIYAQGHSGLHEIIFNLIRTALLLPFAAYGVWIIYHGNADRNFNVIQSKIQQWYYYGALAATLTVVVVQGKFWQYHWMPFCILIVPLAAIAMETMTEHIQGPLLRHYALMGCIVLCSFIQMNPKSQTSLLYDVTHRLSPFGDTYDFASTQPDFGVKAERNTLRYLDSLGVKDREVEICSIEPHLRLHFQHESLGSYGLLYPISERTIGSNHNTPLTVYQRKWQHNYFDTLRKNQPRFIVISLASKYTGVDTILHLIPGFDNFFATQYVKDTAFGSYEIYRHR
jgi:hypothetical protein